MGYELRDMIKKDMNCVDINFVDMIKKDTTS